MTSNHVSLSWDPPHSDLHNGIIREYLVEVTRTSKEIEPGNSGESGDKEGSESGMKSESGSGMGSGSGLESGMGSGMGSGNETGSGDGMGGDGSANGKEAESDGRDGRIARDSGDEGSGSGNEGNGDDGSSDEGSCDDNGDEGSDEVMVMTYRTSTTSILIRSLHPDAAYSIRVAGHTVEVGPYSDPILVYTLEDGMYV